MTDLPVLNGLHHVTAITARASANLSFYTRTLGMRLVKKTVNQDDVSAYHLFYADALARPGTDLTFFDWKQASSAQAGAGTVSETALRVPGGADSLEIWARWFAEQKIICGTVEPFAGTGLASLPFQDAEGQHLRLIAEPEAGTFHPWHKSPVPLEAAIVGLGAVTLTVSDVALTAQFLVEMLRFRPHPRDAMLFEVGKGGPGAQLRLLGAPRRGMAGAGGVHHVAWSVADGKEMEFWRQHLAEQGVAASGPIDRFYFQSLYFRIPGGILFEIATEGPGFTADGEDLEHLGERLSLPPFLEQQRAQIEANLVPLDSVTD